MDRTFEVELIDFMKIHGIGKKFFYALGPRAIDSDEIKIPQILTGQNDRSNTDNIHFIKMNVGSFNTRVQNCTFVILHVESLVDFFQAQL